VTALEDAVVAAFADKLRGGGMAEQIVTRLVDAYGANRLPTADLLTRTIEELSGEPTA
jgi:hypothetical protein